MNGNPYIYIHANEKKSTLAVIFCQHLTIAVNASLTDSPSLRPGKRLFASHSTTPVEFTDKFIHYTINAWQVKPSMFKQPSVMSNHTEKVIDP